MAKIGLYFGSFNPIHNGHLEIAKYIVEQGFSDEVWLVVSPHNPLKKKDGLLPYDLRLKWVQKSVDGKKIKACDIEFGLPQPNYTIDTIENIQKEYPGNQFLLIMGGDNLKNIHFWKEYEKLLSQYEILVYPRGRDVVEPSQGRITVLSAPLIHLSATQLRLSLENEKDISSYVPLIVAKEFGKDLL